MTDTLADLDQNMRQCWRCSHCKWVPAIKSQRFGKICPSIEWGNFHAYSGGGKVITAYALTRDAVPYTDKMLESVFACTMCGGCDVACKTNNGELIEPLDILYALRAKIAADGKSPPAHVAIRDSLAAHGNPYGKPAADRGRWADGLGVMDATQHTVDVLLHIGCAASYTSDYWPELRAIVTLLSRAGVDFGIAYAAERATGEVAFDLGFEAEARDQAKAMAALIEKTGARRVVTCSAGGYAAFRAIWPRLGVAVPRIDISHVTDFVDDLFEARRLHDAGHVAGGVTYHDPCKLGRLSELYIPSDSKWTTVLNNWTVREPAKPIRFGNDGLYDAPRRLLARVGADVTEMERTHNAAWCCGGAGGAREAFPAFADFAARERIEEARATGAATLVTTSCACQQQLGRAAEGKGISVSGLFALLATATVAEPVA